MNRRVPVTEYLQADIGSGRWHCARCGTDLGDARGDYKKGLLVYDRDPRDIYASGIDGPRGYAPDPRWCRIVEYYCPGCGTQVETEYLPPGHPLTRDIEIDLDWLRSHGEPPAGQAPQSGERP